MDIAKSQPTIHTDIPRLLQGNVGAQYWSVYVPAATAYRGAALLETLEQIQIVHAMIKTYPETFAAVSNYQDILRARRQGKIASLIGVEGGHSIEDSVANLNRLFDLGARYMTAKEIYDVIDLWLNEPFAGGRHQRRIEKLDL